MKNKVWQLFFLIIICSVGFFSCNKSDDIGVPLGNWVELNYAPLTGREGAVSFTIGTDCFVGLGYEPTGVAKNGLLSDFWVFHSKTNSWANLGDTSGNKPPDVFPGQPREYAVGFSINTVGYVGLGRLVSGDSTNTEVWFSDFYAYDTLQPVGSRWKRIANFENIYAVGAGIARSNAIGFGLNGLGYVGSGLGDDGNVKNDFFTYNPQTNSWSAMSPSFPGAPFMEGATFTIGNNAYVLNGTFPQGGRQDQFFVYNADSSIWRKLKPIANVMPVPYDQLYTSLERNSGVGFTVGYRGYIALGTGSTNNNSVWEYNPFDDLWIQKTSIGTENGFPDRVWANSWSTSDGRGIIGFGSSGGNTTNSVYYSDIWEFLPTAVYNPYSNL